MIVREAAAADAEALSGLLAELGYTATPAEVTARLDGLLQPMLVAETDGRVIGCLTWHVTPVVHRTGPVGRITMMVVAETHRGQGVGKALVAAAEARTRALGCIMVEVSSNLRRGDAHAFYEHLGYDRTSYRFAKTF